MLTTRTALRVLSHSKISPLTTSQGLRATPTNTKPAATLHIKPAFKPEDTMDVGNYLTGGGNSKMGFGDTIAMCVFGGGAIWLANKVTEEIKDVVWPEVKWMGRKDEKDGEK